MKKEFTTQKMPFEFPFIAKPNIGERGIGVELIILNGLLTFIGLSLVSTKQTTQIPS